VRFTFGRADGKIRKVGNPKVTAKDGDTLRCVAPLRQQNFLLQSVDRQQIVRFWQFRTIKNKGVQKLSAPLC